MQADIFAFELKRYDDAKVLLNNALEMNLSPKDKAVLKMKLADVYLLTDEGGAAPLFYPKNKKE